MIAIAFVLLQVSGTPAAGRPAECAFGDTGRPNVWERVKQPELGKYCDLLASGSSKLAATGMAQARDVLTIAEDADKRLPGRAAPTVLKGRAFAKLAQYTDAYAAFHVALAKDSGAVDEPNSLFAYARSASRTDHAAEALIAYRALLPRASGLTSSDRGSAYLEAGLATMATGGLTIDDAIAIFRQARRESQDALAVVSWLALALALDRANLHDESRAVLAERSIEVKSALADIRVREVLAATPAENDALAALAVETTDPVAAQAAWHRYAATVTSGPWVEHARAREAALSSTKVKQPK